MLKSKARKEAKRQLKIQQEKENILAEQQRKQEPGAQQQERTQALLRSIGLWYGNISTRNNAIIAVGGLALMFGLGQYDATTPETVTPTVAESTPVSPAPRVLTEAEQFQQVVMSNTHSLLALDRAQKMSPVTPIQEPNVEIVGDHSTNQFSTSSARELRQPPSVRIGIPPVPINNSLAHQEEQNKYDAWELIHRKNTLRLHLYSSIAILILVVVIVIAGIFLSYEQLRKGSSSETKFSVKGGAVEISSSIIGFLILFLSLAFFYLYLKEVYPVHEIGAAKENAGLANKN